MEECSQELRGRFLPCVQLHEFEALLFVDPSATVQALEAVGHPRNADQLQVNLQRVKEEAHGSVERINDSEQTAPSKRLLQLVPGYDKVAWGNMAAEAAGLPALRTGCPWLSRWLEQLESLGK